MSIGKKRLFTDEKGNSPLWIDVYVAPFIFFLMGILFPAMFFRSNNQRIIKAI